jgi:site-specific recombinase XerD
MAGTRRKPGALGAWVETYRSGLMRAGYTPGSVRGKLKELGHLGRWMSSRGLEVGDLDESRVEEFLADRRAGGHRRVPGLGSFVLLLEVLREQGVITDVEAPPPTPLDGLIARYRSSLVKDRGLAPATVLRYENLARRFLVDRSGDGSDVDVAGLTGSDVTVFLLAECARLSVGSAKGRVTELRSLLRFFYVEGLTPLALAAAVPPVAGWRDTGLPSSLAAADVEELLESCDRSRPAGIRDFAILMLVARLGLRSAEVARLELDDVDWRVGEIVVRGKARRRDRLPLPVDVGEALAAYLSGGRPDRAGRQVFLTDRAPHRPIRPDLVSDAVRRACRRTGLSPVGAHRLRHALATTMLRNGAALVEISQVLRHRDLATTAIYAKVDVDSLRHVAQPWPGGAR